MPFNLDPALVKLFIFFFSIALLRNTIIYWIARALARQATKKIAPAGKFMNRMHTLMSGDNAHKGVAIIHRWGPIAVAVSFLAPGTKTVVNTGAGLTQMRYLMYLPALLIGCTVHGVIYATIGWAAWVAILTAAAGSPWGIAALTLLLAGLAYAVVALVRRHKKVLTSPVGN